jgi:hypothetical protein
MDELGSGADTQHLLPQLERLPDFIGGFEACQQVREAIGERLCKIILLRECSPDRRPDDALAGVGLVCR